ncbi:4-(cytidine 5'-diphospho)-2-C-methyl-D-erythritol kinase [Phyllobacterium sp. SYP-B3895]|uniref:4-(cytidine 5'-diphospho)-2-C-methyl-D-erythritol kinase n=1 Tax=Phyllobacterium sp. SYP-B3895 TaxID=2663240 RepID=UPI00351A4CCC
MAMLDSLDRTITLTAPAKINLALHVTGRRSDGYHLLDSLVVFAGFGDRISVKRAALDDFAISGPYGHALPDDASNLVLKARDALRAAFPDQATPVAIHLEKHLPVASGIGGGSTDAAAALSALSSLWALDVGIDALASIGLPLGADIPMCLHGQPLIARGVGDEIEPMTTFPRLPLLLANCGASISTPQVFAALDKRDNPPLPALRAMQSLDDVCDYLKATHNHLFQATRALTPGIDDTIAALERTSPRLVRMSGSGATCFGIYDSDSDAEVAAAKLRRDHPDWFVVATHSAMEGI